MGEPGEAGREHQDVVLTWELQAAVNHHMRDLGTKVGSSERAAITLIHQTISIGPGKRILMRNYLYQVGLWVSLWGIVLIINRYRKTQLVVGSTILLAGCPEEYKREESWMSIRQVSKGPSIYLLLALDSR